MIVRVLPWQAGKTAEMIRLADEEFLYIVCMNAAEARRVRTVALSMGANIPDPITWRDFCDHQYYAKGVQGFVIDNLDMCIQQMTTVPIKAVTLTCETA